MPRVLTFPDAEHVHYSNAPLKLMLGQVRFPAVLKIAAPGGLAEFQEEIRDEYSEYSEEQQVGLVIGAEGMQPTSEARNYRFATADGAWSLVVNPTFLSVEASVATKYSTYDEFRDRFANVWAVALRHLEPKKSVQQGLRYIDFLDWTDVAPPDWGRYINSHLLGALGVPELVEHVEHTITDTRFQLGDEAALSLKYGLARGGPDNLPGFLLDTDCFSQAQHEDVTVDAVTGRFNLFHEEIHVLFNWAMTDQARERFRRDPSSD
jgi:uncharacterized protein (TIGR04255 family)